MTPPKNEKIYCDANFLVAYGAKSVKQPEVQKSAKLLFAELVAGECTLMASPLTFDEVWNVSRKEAGPKMVKRKYLYKLDKILSKIGLRLTRTDIVEAFSFPDVIDEIKKQTSTLLSFPKFKVIQIPASSESDGINLALNNLS
jgi:predicted nucleic acid-binding protein